MNVQLLYSIIGLIIALAVLIKAADVFVDGSEGLGRKLGMGDFLIGATIVAIGTSLPELATSTMAALNGETTFAVDNVMGSNMANILLVGGIVVLWAGDLDVSKRVKTYDLPFLLLTTAVFVFMISDGKITINEGKVLLGMMIVYAIMMTSGSSEYTTTEDANDIEKITSVSTNLLYVILGATFTIISANYVVSNVESIATIMDVNMSVLTMIIVALGTSLPEVAVSVAAVRRGEKRIALGNIVGSNIFNILAVVGIPSMLTTLTISQKAFESIIILAITTFLFIFVLWMNPKGARIIGGISLIVYVIFTANAFM